MAAIAGDRYEAAYLLGFAGLRAGEISGLARSSVHLADPPSVDVKYRLDGSGEHARLMPLKTRASEAPVPLPPFVAVALRDHLARQDVERRIVPIAGDGLVFVTAKGLPVNATYFTKHFQALLRQANLPVIRTHDLRPAAASLLVPAGVHPRVAQQLLRHASSQTTMSIYSHVNAAQEREASNALQRVIGEWSRSQSRTRWNGWIAEARRVRSGET